MTSPTRIAVIGTGLMGTPIARNLAAAGHTVSAWNRTAAKLEALAAFDVTPLPSARAGADADIVIVMLSDGPVCDALLLGDEGLIAAMTPGSALVVMSSIPVASAEQQAAAASAHGVDYLDAPVSGGERGAIDGTLAIMAGGEATAFARLAAVFGCLGRPTHVGPAGCGQLAKLANQLIVANTIATVAEALLLAERGGADPARVREALLGGFADSRILQLHGQRMIERDFAPGGPAKWQHKDTRTALETATTLGLDLPVSQSADALFGDMLDHGDGELDHSGLIRELRRHNALPVT
ncbi:NAD(P)-dependent oxidoreductase [Salinicola aestuarinus]|uniref:NAD(P)-dependent oxidoreductase n=1 Tax=Salinicola aestuarinus TaxID=1949082 RepID=UPI000DA1A299|nr:NAD(P)-dependent oxidoreductase [Salinicola aestuarinus]